MKRRPPCSQTSLSHSTQTAPAMGQRHACLRGHPSLTLQTHAVSLYQCRTRHQSSRTGYGAQDARLGTMHRMHSWTRIFMSGRGGSRLEALAAVANPGLAEVTDCAHKRHACGILPSMRHAAISSKTPACADCFSYAVVLMLSY